MTQGMEELPRALLPRPLSKVLTAFCALSNRLEGLSLPASLWESAIFPARIRDYQPSMLDELLSSGDIVWVGSGSPAHGEAGQITWYLADSPLLVACHSSAVDIVLHQTRDNVESTSHAPATSRIMPDDAIMQTLESGGAYPVHRLAALCTETAEQSDDQ
jgi:ATP-dependent Lhr-like helicase